MIQLVFQLATISQFFANIYLNELDQFVKRTLKIPNYTRYMDDFILLLHNKKNV